jgi:hypothetical protein
MQYSEILILIIAIVGFIIYHMYFRTIDVRYYISDSVTDSSFKNKTRQIINNTKWSRYQVRESPTENDADVVIKLSNRSEMDQWHNNPEYYEGTKKQIRFSITTQGKLNKPRIYIDEGNWLNGVPESGLSLEEYRKYVIRHEFMHGLGYDHQPCNSKTAVNGVCPVLYQSTRGCPKGFKCGYEVLPVDFTDKLSFSYLD